MCAYQSNGNGSSSDDNLSKSNGRKIEKLTTDVMPIPTMNGNTAKRIEVVNFETVDEYGPSFVEAYESTESVTGDEEQYNKIYNAIYDLLDSFNVNWDDPNYTDTPKRVAKAYLEHWASGYAINPEDEITVFPNSSGSGDLVLVKDMRYYSTCSHHLAPFHGYGAIAYLPGENLVGLSKLGRMLNIFSRRFQLQERIGAQTADKLMELLKPKGVMVMLYDTEHMCMSSRGVQLHEASTTTVAARGLFESDRELRKEVLAMMNNR